MITTGDILVKSGIDVDNSTVYLTGEVDSTMYKLVAYSMVLLSDKEDITIVLNTEGGDYYQALAIYDLLKFHTVHRNLKILCVGPVMSAGIIILMAAKERIALPNTQLMIHYGEDSNDTAQSVKHNLDLLKKFKTILATRVNVGKRKIDGWFKHDTYYFAEDALKVGLIDRITQ